MAELARVFLGTKFTWLDVLLLGTAAALLYV